MFIVVYNVTVSALNDYQGKEHILKVVCIVCASNWNEPFHFY